MPKQRTGLCVYCGAETVITRDHVIPRCLFNRPFPPNMLTVSSCEPCNSAKALNDDYFRDMLTSDIDGHNSPEAKEIFENKVRRSVGYGSSVIARIMKKEGKIEPFLTKGGIHLGDYPTIHLNEDRVNLIFSTIIRGLYYSARKQRIPDDYEFHVLRHRPWNSKDILEQFQKFSLNGPIKIGKVFECAFAATDEDMFTTVWLLIFYERVIFTVNTIKTGSQL